MSLITKKNVYPALLLTYGSAALGILGIVIAYRGDTRFALLLMVIAGLFDALDGPVARMTRQTPHQKLQGIVADSLADVVSFGALPAVVLCVMGGMQWPYLIIAVIYITASLHRLAVYSATAIQRDVPTTHFTGIPVLGALLLPLLFCITGPIALLPALSSVLLTLLAIGYVSSLRVPKPHGRWAYLSYVVIAVVLVTGLLWR